MSGSTWQAGKPFAVPPCKTTRDALGAQARLTPSCFEPYPSARGTQGMRETSIPSSAKASACSGVLSP